MLVWPSVAPEVAVVIVVAVVLMPDVDWLSPLHAAAASAMVVAALKRI